MGVWLAVVFFALGSWALLAVLAGERKRRVDQLESTRMAKLAARHAQEESARKAARERGTRKAA